jgi:non-ribosomal peptide synthetase-like protein
MSHEFGTSRDAAPTWSHAAWRARLDASVAAFGALLFRFGGASEVTVAVQIDSRVGRARMGLRSATTVRELANEIGAMTSELYGRRLGSIPSIVTLASTKEERGDEQRPRELTLALRGRSLTIDRTTLNDAHLAAFDLPGVDALRESWSALVSACLRDPGTRLADLPLIGHGERRRQLDSWAQGQLRPELLAPGLLQGEFERQAGQSPERVALRSMTSSLTYGALNARAEAAAARLRAAGVGPGTLVAFQLPRSIDVYPILLGILKAGAAYVPIDPETPADRVGFILADCGARLFVQGAPAATAVAMPAGCLMATPELNDLPSTGGVPERATTPEDLCYVIYTSGSTGRPKGVAVEHRSALHLVRAEQALFGIAASDRVLQGFSLAFDASIEETWLAFAAGATLVVATKEDLLSRPADLVRAEEVTVLSCVPTLLATIKEELPSVRLLIVGGEECPAELVARWATAGRSMFNTYGPTEATVIATYTPLAAGDPVSIGRPIPNYFVYILDAFGHPLPPGSTGEICIGGVGLARGYVANPTLTAGAFVTNPIAEHRAIAPVVYRTGDRGRYDAQGRIVFCGRGDAQVKIRGFRIELGEIESALLRCPGVWAAAIAMESFGGARLLYAHVVPEPGADVVPAKLKELLKGVLPSYMVPAQIQLHERLPTLTSGKVDRKALSGLVRNEPAAAPPGPVALNDPLERIIAAVWADLLPTPVATADDDFFDLGGDSLLAAQAISAMRGRPELAVASIKDLYDHPTIRTLARALGERARRREAPTAAPATPRPRDLAGSTGARAAAARLLFSVGQLAGLYLLAGAHALEWVAPFGALAWMLRRGSGDASALLAAAAVVCTGPLALLVLALAAKWAVIGRYRPGRHKLWGGYYLRWWFVERLLDLAPFDLLAGTPLMSAYCRLLGARIGANVLIASADVRAFDLIEIGDRTTIGVDSRLAGAKVEDGWLVIGRVAVGRDCVVGHRSVLDIDTCLADDAELGDLSLLPCGQSIPPGGRWIGSPAAPAASGDERRETLRAPAPSTLRRVMMTASLAACVLAMPLLPLVALVPAFAMFIAVNRLAVPGASLSALGSWALGGSLRYLWTAPLAAAAFLIAMGCATVVLKRVILRPRPPGRYWVWSCQYARLWIFQRMMAQAMDVMGELYGTMFINPWFRALGVKLGRRSEISTMSGFVPDHLVVGDHAFIADAAAVGVSRLAHGFIEVKTTTVGNRAFIGNSAVVPAGACLGDGCLIGCLSTTPSTREPTVGTWFGSPAILLPRRQTSATFASQLTYGPPRRLVAQRVLFEGLRVLIPPSAVIALACLLLATVVRLSPTLPPIAMLALVPVLFTACGVLAMGLCVALKWIVIGRHRPGEVPLWSRRVWRSELATTLQENLAGVFLPDMLLGTPYLAMFFRALGAKIGKRVYMETTELTEYDLVSIGDDVCLNGDCTLQTHLFEDRVMKMSRVVIGDGCTVGADAVVLYDTVMEPGANLGPLSLLMKGEVLGAGAWQGSPARLAWMETRVKTSAG